MIVDATAENRGLTALFLPVFLDFTPPSQAVQAERAELETRLTAIRWRNLVRHQYTELVELAEVEDARLDFLTDILKVVAAFSAEPHLAFYTPSDLTCGFMWNNSP
eukprot:TRINITY_DN3330_c0_g1_i1.p1 TRINITY_DN3330_c0_g1~~TRINITY_DN3330_c0_g1_i1.p1  ORF type:complete len:106 (-),score=7.82 TRINITY_DN3330_c0_g1_i1:52-369(-)